jgi:hypothetical protein
VIEHGATLGIDVEVVRHDPAAKGLAVLAATLDRGAGVPLVGVPRPPAKTMRLCPYASTP